MLTFFKRSRAFHIVLLAFFVDCVFACGPTSEPYGPLFSATACAPDTYTKTNPVTKAAVDTCARNKLGATAGTTSCLQDGYGISQECAYCFSDFATVCVYYNCVGYSAPCGSFGNKGNTPECAQCARDKCFQRFSDCSGLADLPQ